MLSQLSDSYWGARYYGARRVLATNGSLKKIEERGVIHMIRERRNKEKLVAYYSKFMEEGICGYQRASLGAILPGSVNAGQ
jgi:hypothetical protein